MINIKKGANAPFFMSKFYPILMVNNYPKNMEKSHEFLAHSNLQRQQLVL